MSRGCFILIEGLDRCGKTTQNKKLLEYLVARGSSAHQLGFPDRQTPTGKLIDAHLTKQARVLDLAALNLLFSSNRWEKKAFIEETLKAGTHIVCDRYVYSGLAYSIANGLDKVRGPSLIHFPFSRFPVAMSRVLFLPRVM